MLNNHYPGSGNRKKFKLTPKCLRKLLKTIGNLSRTGMEAGNSGDFKKAFLNLDDALSLSRDLNKNCLEAKLLNNLGILHTMSGKWDRALLEYDKSMKIVVDHYGTENILYRTLQKNISYLIDPDVAIAE